MAEHQTYSWLSKFAQTATETHRLIEWQKDNDTWLTLHRWAGTHSSFVGCTETKPLKLTPDVRRHVDHYTDVRYLTINVEPTA